MKTICLDLWPERPERSAESEKHFKAVGLKDVTRLCALHGHTSGLNTAERYDRYGCTQLNSFQVTNWLAHYMAWNAVVATGREATMIVEDDARFVEDWAAKLQYSMLFEVPPDFDWLYVGSYGYDNVPRTRVCGNVYDVRYPFTTHAYVVSVAGAKKLIETQRRCYAPVDHAIIEQSFPSMKVYTLIPRLAVQDPRMMTT
jgi:GR25 family glycosyltransferase involved in LPS biosynthesis